MESNPRIEEELINGEFLEALYQQYQINPFQLSPSWRQYFKALDFQISSFLSAEAKLAPTPPFDLVISRESRILRLLDAYRTYGHLFAKINPIAIHPIQEPYHLKMSTLGFEEWELDQLFPTHHLLSKEEAPLREIIQTLQSLYCGSIGFEYQGIVQNEDLEHWIQQRIESGFFKDSLSIDEKKLILQYLNQSGLLESFLHTKYVGQKRFSLEGAETFIPMLIFLIDKGAEMGVEEIILGMAHRGRLNVLSNILRKSYQEIFAEFDEGYIPESERTGDVKYHKGYTSDSVVTNYGKKIKLTLPPNPSHLESVDPVIEGEVRARQFLKGDEPLRQKIIPILVHGDAAVSGQGIIYETMQFYNLPGYKTGGTLHFVINNQIGFTTIPRDLRSTLYCTDIARAFGAPVLHVNAEDPEACVQVAVFALEIRQQFHCDVFIDLNCYRKYGHNETDEPAFTQPIEYQLIKKKKAIRELYQDQLVQQGVFERQIIDRLEEEFKKKLQQIHAELQIQLSQPPDQHLTKVVSPQNIFQPFSTKLSRDVLITVAQRSHTIPPNFHLHPKLEGLIKERLNMVIHDKPIDWGMAEHLAYATLLWEGRSVRFSGQDSGRGTFSHRHAIWVDQVMEKEYFPLAYLKTEQGRFEIWNSPLSELAILAFEYGYSVAYPEGLTIWEAQFGDFGNGAQVVIDQYIASGEQKWGQQSGLVLFLPHGYEGQGPEHSSGRLERFLSLAGHENMQIVNPTTPAQFFHLLRRQVLRPLRKPLVVFTPKGLLRHPACVSPLQEFVQGAFQEILDDPTHSQSVQYLILCSGRIYYDLSQEREKRKASGIVLVRIEQLYPLHQERLKELIQAHQGFQECLWVQEEPQNMGAWHFIRPYLEDIIPKGIPLRYIGRPSSASPATGSHYYHHQEHLNILNQVFHS